MFSSKIYNDSFLNLPVLQSLSIVKELREARDVYELKTFLTLHIREGAWQLVLLFTDELPSEKLPEELFDEMLDVYLELYADEDEDEEVFSSSLYSSKSGILKAWPIEHDPDWVTLCKAIANRDWKVTRLILLGVGYLMKV